MTRQLQSKCQGRQTRLLRFHNVMAYSKQILNLLLNTVVIDPIFIGLRSFHLVL